MPAYITNAAKIVNISVSPSQMIRTQRESRIGLRSGAGSRWIYPLIRQAMMVAHMKAICVRVVNTGIASGVEMLHGYFIEGSGAEVAAVELTYGTKIGRGGLKEWKVSLLSFFRYGQWKRNFSGIFSKISIYFIRPGYSCALICISIEFEIRGNTSSINSTTE